MCKYKGDLYLEYSDDEYEASYKAEVTLCKKGEKISFEFKGNDNDEGRFSGECRASVRGDKYHGLGIFKPECSDSNEAQVNFTIKEDKEGFLSLTGTWEDEGEDFFYELEADLSIA